MQSRRSVPSVFAALVALSLGAAPFDATALGFGPSRLATVLGGPLDFSVVVSLDGNEILRRECIVAEVTVGETRLAPAQVLAVVEAGGTARQQIVRVQTTVGITEPVVAIDVALGCEATVSRRFVHLVDPPPIGIPVGAAPGPSAGTPGAAAAGAAPGASAPASRRPVRRPSPAAAPSQKPAASGTSRSRDASARAEATADALPAASAPRWSLPGPLVRWLDAIPWSSAHASVVPAEAGLVAQVAAPTAAPVAASGPTATVEQARIADLESGLAELRGETRETQREMSILQSRLRDAERERWANPIVYASTALALIACLVALRASRQGAAARRADGEGAADDGTSSAPPFRRVVDAPSAVLRTTDQIPFPDRRAVDRSLPLDARQAAAVLASMPSAISASASLATPAAAPPAVAAPAPRPVGPLPVPATRPDSRAAAAGGAEGPPTTRPAAFDASITRPTTISEPAAIGGLEVTTMLAPVRANREAANTGALDSGWQPMQASAVEELVDLMQQVEFFLVLGQVAPAVDLLEGHVRSTEAPSPLPFLDLLALHGERDDEAAYDRVRGLWRGRFGDDAPPWEARARALEGGDGLPDERTVLARLQALWPTPLQALAALEALLFREEDRGRVFARPVYHDLHFLYGVARDLADHVETDSGAVDLFLPIDTAPTPPFTVLSATTPFRGPAPSREAMLFEEAGDEAGDASTVDVDLSAWPESESAMGELAVAEEISIVRSPGRRGAA